MAVTFVIQFRYPRRRQLLRALRVSLQVTIRTVILFVRGSVILFMIGFWAAVFRAYLNIYPAGNFADAVGAVVEDIALFALENGLDFDV